MSAPLILVTGGAGFIGSNIAARLAQRSDCDVAVCDWMGSDADGKWRNLAKHAIADIIDPDALEPFLAARAKDIEAIVHMGAISSTTETDVDLIVERNIRFSQRLWRWCAQVRKPLIYASSAATYGDGAQGFVDDNSLEAVNALRPLNAYGWSKKAFDVFALRSAARGHAPPAWSGLRFFNVYGPGEGHKGGQKSVVAHMFPRVQAGEPVRLFRSHHPDYPDGGQLRDFVYVRDCVDVVEWLLESGQSGGVINVGTGKARTFADLARALFNAFGAPENIAFVDTPEAIREKYQYFTEADMNRLRGHGYARQFTTIESGVADYAQRYLAAGDPHP
ncbi:MAG: ADP-glyceromanno-heptose 6-epimerase [Alphaproteobacteria bacterium]|nr:ADP-glyceromanno-heptose 6-epimerase [Alphaproteobacteria bacterium]